MKKSFNVRYEANLIRFRGLEGPFMSCMQLVRWPLFLRIWGNTSGILYQASSYVPHLRGDPSLSRVSDPPQIQNIPLGWPRNHIISRTYQPGQSD